MPPQHAAALMLQYSKSKGSLRVLLARSQFSLPQVLPPRALAPSLPLSLLIACPVLRQIALIRGFLCLPEHSRTLPNPPGPSFSPRVRRIPLHLLRLSRSLLLPQLVGVSWRLDYVVKSKHLDHVNRPLYILRFLCIARDGSEVLHTREMGVCVWGGEVLSSACTPLHGFRPPSRGRTLLPRASECV